MKDNNLNIGLELRAAANDDSREVEFVISSNSVDAHGTVIPLSAWKLERYLKNPIVTYGHSAGSNDPDKIIGTSVIEVKDNELRATVTFEPEDINPLAEKVLKKIKAGTLRMASVGFRAKKWHWGDKNKGEDPVVLYFDEVELLEWSIVPVGSNPDAMKRMDEFITECKGACEIGEREQFPEKRMAAKRAVLERKIKNL